MYNEENFKSQFGQDKILVNLLKGKRNGFFIELGAGNGVSLSNSYFFERELGWIGVLIEPEPYSYSMLWNNRSGFKSNALCSDVSGVEKEFLLAGATSGIISDSSGYWIKKNIKEGNNSRTKMVTRTLEEVLDGFPTPKNIDFLSIDVEGHEYEVLKNFPFNKYVIDIICIENNSSIDETDNIDKAKKLLENNDYRLEVSTNTDLFYRKNVYYSQQDEDKILFNKYLNYMGGFFIELGAMDGITYSNTKFFEDALGWNGILIEPLLDHFTKLIVNRPNCKCFNYAVSKVDGQVDFLGHSAVGGLLSSMHEDHKKEWGLDKTQPFKVKSLPLNRIMEGLDVKRVDLFSIDVEGGELEVLETFDWNIPVYIVLIELDRHNRNKDQICRDFLKVKGFEFDMCTGLNEVWIRKENKD